MRKQYFIFALIIIILTVTLNAKHKEKENMTPASSGYAPVNGINMYYETYGKGDMPLIMIHGGGSTIQSSFANIIPLVSRFTKVICVELQAHGRTSDREAPESFIQDADDVAGLLKYLNISKADLFGFSNGGTTALQIAIRHSQLVNKIIIVSANYRRDGLIQGFFEGMQNATIDNMPQFLKDAFLSLTPDTLKLITMFTKDRDRMINFKDIPDEDIKSIKAKALVISGDRDVIKPEHSVKLAQLIPGARLIILPGTHGQAIGEAGEYKEGDKQPGITAALVEDFIKK